MAQPPSTSGADLTISVAPTHPPTVSKASIEPAPTPGPKSAVHVVPPSGEEQQRGAVGFARAAIVFRDRLNSMRVNPKRDSAAAAATVASSPPKAGDGDDKPKVATTTTVTALASPTTPLSEKELEAGLLPPGSGTAKSAVVAADSDPGQPAEPSRTTRSIRLLRLTQSTITSFLSLTIAVLQGRVYGDYRSTSSVAGAWPSAPNLFPTLLLLAVAAASLFFDICLLAAWGMPARWARTDGGRRARAGLLRTAERTHYVIVSAKAVAYVLTSAVCRAGFDYGNSSGTNADLWSWTCSQADSTLGQATGAKSECTGQVRRPWLKWEATRRGDGSVALILSIFPSADRPLPLSSRPSHGFSPSQTLASKESASSSICSCPCSNGSSKPRSGPQRLTTLRNIARNWTGA